VTITIGLLKNELKNMEIDINQIKPSPYQPRTVFEVEELKESIEHNGLLMPLVVRNVNDYFELLDGDRRLHALKLLGMKTADCSIIVASDALARKMVWKINTDREDYSIEEQAIYIKNLVEKEGMYDYQIETELDIHHSWVKACLNVWLTPKDIQDNIFGRTAKNVTYHIYMADIQDLESVFTRSKDEANGILRQIIDKRMTADEKRELIGVRQKKVDESVIQKAEEALDIIEPTIPTKLETSEDFEKAAKVLKKKAYEVKTPEEKQQITEQKKQKHAEAEQKSRDRVERIKSEAKVEGMKMATKEVIQQNPALVQAVINDIIEDSKTISTTVSPIQLSPEELQRLEDYRTHLQEVEKNLDTTKIVRNKNWLAHGQILSMIETLRCPCCGKTIEDLVWQCCGISVKDAYAKLEGNDA
jgi:ParB family chromosome partitioning protein